MEVIGIRFCSVAEEAESLAGMLAALGLPQGPVDAHGERIYFLQAPTGLQISFQSALATPPG